MIDKCFEIELGEAFDSYTECDEAESSADPGEECPLVGEVVAGDGACVVICWGFEN